MLRLFQLLEINHACFFHEAAALACESSHLLCGGFSHSEVFCQYRYTAKLSLLVALCLGEVMRSLKMKCPERGSQGFVLWGYLKHQHAQKFPLRLVKTRVQDYVFGYSGWRGHGRKEASGCVGATASSAVAWGTLVLVGNWRRSDFSRW